MEKFVYLNESSIDPNLKCSICKKPYLNPVSLRSPCEDIFCRQCIQLNLQNHLKNCSNCQNKNLTIEDLQDESRALKKMVDQLLVKCSLCHQSNIQRIQFEEHLNNFCPKRIVSCYAKDILCRWNGHYDQLDSHTTTCPYEILRKDLKQLIQQSQQTQTHLQIIRDQNENFKEEIKLLKIANQTLTKQLEDYLNQINQFKEENQVLNEQNQLLKDQNILFDQLKDENQSLKEQNILFDQLKNENQSLKEEIQNSQLIEEQSKQHQIQSQKFQTAFENLQENYQKNLNELNQIQTASENLQENYQKNLNELYQIQTENEHFQKQIEELQSIILSLQDQNQFSSQNEQSIITDYQKIEQKTKEHLIYLQNQIETLKNEILQYQFEVEHKDIQIKQLTTKPILQPKELSIHSNYENNNLQELINLNKSNSLINLNGEQLNEDDIDIIINYAFILKKSHSIILSNNSLTDNSLSKLFSSLKWNQTLTKLCISNNYLSDVSIRYLLESLSYDNKTLKELILHSNQINDQAFISLSNIFKSNQTLITIGLQNNQITDQSVRYFSNIIFSYENSIENISLYSNQLITDLSIQSFIDIIQKKISLKTLWIWDCQLSNQGKQNIQQAIQSNIHLDIRL